MTNDQDTPPDEALPKIGSPATRALALAGYTRLSQLTGVTAEELLALHGVGPRAIRILRGSLAERGLAFAGDPAPGDPA